MVPEDTPFLTVISCTDVTCPPVTECQPDEMSAGGSYGTTTGQDYCQSGGVGWDAGSNCLYGFDLAGNELTCNELIDGAQVGVEAATYCCTNDAPTLTECQPDEMSAVGSYGTTFGADYCDAGGVGWDAGSTCLYGFDLAGNILTCNELIDGAQVGVEAATYCCTNEAPADPCAQCPMGDALEDMVCGMDGQTYMNDCLATCINVDVKHDGPCGAGDCMEPMYHGCYESKDVKHHPSLQFIVKGIVASSMECEQLCAADPTIQSDDPNSGSVGYVLGGWDAVAECRCWVDNNDSDDYTSADGDLNPEEVDDSLCGPDRLGDNEYLAAFAGTCFGDAGPITACAHGELTAGGSYGTTTGQDYCDSGGVGWLTGSSCLYGFNTTGALLNCAELIDGAQVGVVAATYCCQSPPTPSPTTASGMVCPTQIPQVPSTSICICSGDPHCRQFDGTTADAYTDGDFKYYVGDTLQIYVRNTKGETSTTYSPAGISAVHVTGSIIGGMALEFWAHDNINNAMDSYATIDGVKPAGNYVTQLTTICQSIQDYVCNCEFSVDPTDGHLNRIFIRFDEMTTLEIERYDVSSWLTVGPNWSGWSNIYLNVNPAIMNDATDTGICKHVGRGDEFDAFVDPFASDRLKCQGVAVSDPRDTDPFTVGQSASNPLTDFCDNQRRRVDPNGNNQASHQAVIDNCDATLKADAEAACSGCNDGGGDDSAFQACVFDACLANSLDAITAQTSSCETVVAAQTPPEQRQDLCQAPLVWSENFNRCVPDWEDMQVQERNTFAPTPDPTENQVEDDPVKKESNFPTTAVVIIILAASLGVAGALVYWQCKNRSLKQSIDLEDGKAPLSPKPTAGAGEDIENVTAGIVVN